MPAPKVEKKSKLDVQKSMQMQEKQPQTNGNNNKQTINTAATTSKTTVWKINKASAGQYMKYYKQIVKGNEQSCPAPTALQFFMKSKIGKEKLKKIYKICNQDPRIAVAPRVFCVLFHIIQMVRKGTEIPNSLPGELASVMTPSPKKNKNVNNNNNGQKRKSNNMDRMMGTNVSPGADKKQKQEQQQSPADILKNLKLQPQKRRGKFIFDAASKLWYNTNSKLFFNEKTKQYSKAPNGPFYMYNESSKKLQLITT